MYLVFLKFWTVYSDCSELLWTVRMMICSFRKTFGFSPHSLLPLYCTLYLFRPTSSALLLAFSMFSVHCSAMGNVQIGRYYLVTLPRPVCSQIASFSPVFLQVPGWPLYTGGTGEHLCQSGNSARTAWTNVSTAQHSEHSLSTLNNDWEHFK